MPSTENTANQFSYLYWFTVLQRSEECEPLKCMRKPRPLHTPFVIARGSRNEARVVVVELEEDGIKAVGECTPYPRYGESEASVMAQIMTIAPQLENRLTRDDLQTMLPAGAARNAVDCALWDLASRKAAMTLATYTGVTLPHTPSLRHKPS